MVKKRALIHPFLFAIYPVLLLFSQNVHHTKPQAMLFPIGVIVGFTTLLLALIGWLLKDYEKAGAITSLFLVFFFFYGYIHDLFELLIPVRYEFLMSTLGLAYLLAVYLIIRKRSSLRNLTNFLNLVIAVLVLITVFNIGLSLAGTGNQPVEASTQVLADDTVEGSDALRDIYYIILERYGAEDTLEKQFDYDNEEFLDFLSSRGFYVASESRSNYLKTANSLASSLNMKYINYLSEEVDQTYNWKPIYEMIEEHEVWRFLNKKGYKYIHLGGWWEPTRKNKYATESKSFVFLSEFSASLLRTTAIYPIIYRLHIGPFGRRSMYESSLERFEKLGSIPEEDGPTFTFAHMYITHDPYVFDRDGEYLSQEKANNRSSKENYINSLIFANEKVKQVVEDLLSQYDSDNLPIVVIQGDEGPLPRRYREDEYNFDWKDEATKEELRQKMRILNAYYLPGVEDDLLYPSITPVNTFRLIFNLYFGTEYEILDDKSYAFRDAKNIYDFFDVTDIVDYQ